MGRGALGAAEWTGKAGSVAAVPGTYYLVMYHNGRR